jgi:hypothetical protein
MRVRASGDQLLRISRQAHRGQLKDVIAAIKWIYTIHGRDDDYPNHPLLYATHQHRMSKGKVSARLNQMGRATSMINPRTTKSIQKIFFSM